MVTPCGGGVVGAGDPERVAQAEVQDLVGQPQAHCRVRRVRDPRQRVDRRADGRPEPVGPEPDRVVGRQPGLGRGRGDDRAGLVVVRVERGVERDRDDLRRRDEPGDALVEVDEARQRRDRERRLGQVVEVVLASPGLWTMTIACGVAPWISASVTDE